MTTVAITGVAGYIGSTLASALEERGYTVVGIDREQPLSQWSGDNNAQFVEGVARVDRVADLSEAGACCGLLEGCEVLIHLAGDGCPQADFLTSLLPNNVAATYNILEEAKKSGIGRVIFASSNHTQIHSFEQPDAMQQDFAGSRTGTSRSDASNQSCPDSFYGVSKIVGEELGKYYSTRLKSFDFIALRIGWVAYDDPSCLTGSSLNDYLRAMWLSRRDLVGFFLGALLASRVDVDDFFVGYAVSNNCTRIYDLGETCRVTGYNPLDSSDSYFHDKWP